MFQSRQGSSFCSYFPLSVSLLPSLFSLSSSLSIQRAPASFYTCLSIPLSLSVSPEPSTAGPLGQTGQPQAASYSWWLLGGKPRPRRPSKGGTEKKQKCKKIKSGGEQRLPIYCAAEERERSYRTQMENKRCGISNHPVSLEIHSTVSLNWPKD